MLTSRGWWFIVLAVAVTALGAGFSDLVGNGLAVLGLALLAWFLYEWAQFAYLFYVVIPKLRLTREVRDERKAVPVLWAEGEFDVVVRITQTMPGDIPHAILADWVPTDGKLISGSEQVVASMRRDSAVDITYRLRCPVPGELIFEGVRLRVADRHGFFYHRTLIADGSRYPVLPRLTGAESQRRGSKRHNIFPPPGTHRLRRPGGGSELLDLRDYMPGDPPKMIAWKPSARKDKLFTKEFESEVPVRCTLFVDASESTRLGGKRTKISKLVNLSAAVAESAVADRDHVGLVVFDEETTQQMRPKRSRRHVIDMLHLLAKAAKRPTPIGPFADSNALARLAYPVASELHPDLTHERANSTPWTMFLSPPSDYRRGWWILIFLVPIALFVLGLIVSSVGLVLGYAGPIRNYIWMVASVVRGIGWWWFFGLVAANTLVAIILWLTHVLSGQMQPWALERRRRKQLGLLFATLDDDAAGAESHYLHDDQMFARRAQRFLAEHHARYPVRLYDARGRYLFHSRPKLEILTSALNQAVARGRDNELFVLLADLVELSDDLDHLLRAVRVCVARHHQVMVVVPWPDDVPEPPAEAPPADQLILRKADRFQSGGLQAIVDEVNREAIAGYHRAFFKLRREFGRLGVLVVRSSYDETVQVVLDRMDRLRGIGRRR